MDNNQQIVHFEEIYDSPMIEIGETIVDEIVQAHDMNDSNLEHVTEVECGEIVIVTDGQENGEIEIDSFQDSNIDYSQYTNYEEIDESSKIPIRELDERERQARLYAASQPLHDDSFSDESQDYSYHEKLKIVTPQRKKRGRPPGSLNKTSNKSGNKPKPKKIPPKREKSIPLSLSDDSISEEELIYPPFIARRKEPKKRAFRHRLQWRDPDMLEALKSVQEMKTTIRGAAKQFSVPYSTLKDRVHGRVRHGTKPGVKTALSPEEEEELVRYISDMQNAGFHLRYVDVRDRAGELLRMNHGSNNPYGNSSPGHNWLSGFLRRHPGLEFRRPNNKAVLPSVQKQKAMLRRFYETTAQIYKRNKITHKPDRIYCVSELRLSCGGLPTTILVAMAADGSLLPPFVVFQGTHLKLQAIKECYPEATFTGSYDGHVNEDMFLWWFRDHFLRHTNAKFINDMGINRVSRKPMALFLSRWVVDITLQLSQKAKEERLHLICMPPGVAHLLQPLDDAIVNILEVMIEKKVTKHLQMSNESFLSHKAFSQILAKIWRKAITSEHITLKYTRNGLYPLNPFAITNERIQSASQLMAKAQMIADKEVQNDDDDVSCDSDISSGNDIQSKQDGLSGLSILSVLSSHEYNNMERQQQILEEADSKDINYIEEQLNNREITSEEKTEQPVQRKYSKHSKHEHSNHHSGKSSHILQQQLQRLKQQNQLQEQQQLQQLAQLKQEVTVQSQLTESLHNTEQTDLAINSILKSSGCTSPPRTTHRSKRYRSASSCTDDADETSWNLQQLTSLASNETTEICEDNEMNVVYEDIAGTIDISSSFYEQPKKQTTVRRGPKKKKPGETRPNLSNYTRKYRQPTAVEPNTSLVNLCNEQFDPVASDVIYNQEAESQIVIEQPNIIYDHSSNYVIEPNDVIEQSDDIVIDQSDGIIIDQSQVIMDPQCQYIQYVTDVDKTNDFEEVEYVESSEVLDANCVIINPDEWQQNT